MILDKTGRGPLGAAIKKALRAAESDGVNDAPDGDSRDLFMAALGCRAIVASAGDSLLDGKLDPSPSPERTAAVVKAANAPGVKLVVLVAPAHAAYAVEEEALKADGVPYVVLRSPPLLEELALAAKLEVGGSLWLGRGKTMRVATADGVAAAVVKALGEDSWQGATVDVPSEELDVTEAFRRAAKLAGGKTEVHRAPPALSNAVRTAMRWFGASSPPALALYERVLAAAA